MKLPSPLAWPLLLALLLAVAPAPLAPLAHAAALRVSWDPSPATDLESYLLFWGTAAGRYDSPLAIPKEATSFRLADLSPDTVYYLALKAVGSGGLESPFSAEVSARTFAAPPPGDGDGDGIPDEWEVRFGLDPADAADALRDADGDGYTNLAEWLNATDPTDRLSAPGELPTRVLKATVRTYEPGCRMRATETSTGRTWTAEAQEVAREMRLGSVFYTYAARLEVPCGLCIQLEFEDGSGCLHPLYFASDPQRRLLTRQIKVDAAEGDPALPIRLGLVRYSSRARCTVNPLGQVDSDGDGVADYHDRDYLRQLRGL